MNQGAEQTVERLGKFELLDQIGHGGMATVHRALLRGMGGFERQVVIKRILPELASDDHFVKMFIAEAKLSAQLDHPNIVQIYDFGVVDKTYYLAMEFLEGVTLLNFIKKHGKADPIPPAAAAYVIHQVCLGLHYAHCLERDGRPLGLVHRDVSPANVMLTAHGGVKLLDFGIAKAVEAIEREDTRTGTLKGKWSYMAPEQVEGKDVTPRSDIFSAGIMFWEMLTARRLFKAKTDYLTLSNVVRAKVPPISTFRSDVPEAFDRVCAKALARDPNDRYQTADEMADALEEILMTSRFTASQLSTMVGTQISTWETTASAEPSASNSASLSDSAVGFVVGSGEGSVSSLAKGEAASFSPLELSGRSWVRPALIGGGAIAAILLIAVLAIWLGGESQSPPETKGGASTATKAKSCQVRVSSSPPGASVRVIGEAKAQGKTPMILHFPLRTGSRKFELSLPGYVSRTMSVDLTVPKTEVDVELSPVSKPAVVTPPVVKPAVSKPDVTKPDVTKARVTKARVTKVHVTKARVTKARVTKARVTKPKQHSTDTRHSGTKTGKRPKKPPKVPDLTGGGLADPYGS